MRVLLKSFSLLALALLGASTASAQFYVNAPLSTGATSESGVTAPAGTTWSENQHDTGNLDEANSFAGINCGAATTEYRCADDFTVPAASAGWTVSAVTVYVYKTGFEGETSPIAAGTLRIWNQPPNDTLTGLLCGDDTTNVLASSTDATMFRIFSSVAPPPGNTPGTTRKVWKVELSVPAACAGANFLSPGTYWVDWNTTSTEMESHFAPLATEPGVRGLPGWNARQLDPTGWIDALDVGAPDSAPDVPMDFPFELIGSGCTVSDLSLHDDTVLDTRVFEVCGTIQVGPNYMVAGPNGDLTLTASDSVIFKDGASVGSDGRLTVKIDASLVP